MPDQDRSGAPAPDIAAGGQGDRRTGLRHRRGPTGNATAWASARESRNADRRRRGRGAGPAFRAAEGEGMTLGRSGRPAMHRPAAGQIARRSNWSRDSRSTRSAFGLAAVKRRESWRPGENMRGAFVLSACPFRAPRSGDARGAGSLRTDRSRRDYRPARVRRAVTTGGAVTEFRPGKQRKSGLCGRGLKAR